MTDRISVQSSISTHSARESGDGLGQLDGKYFVISTHSARESGDRPVEVEIYILMISTHSARESGDDQVLTYDASGK